MADNDFGKKIEDFGQNIWKKTQSAVDIASLNNDINTKSRELSAVYADIGAKYCAEKGEEAEAAFPQLYAEALMLAEDIAKLQERVQRKKGVKKCPGCGDMVPESAAYCSKCGTCVPDPEPEQPDANACKICGEPLREADAFCPRCGAKKK